MTEANESVRLLREIAAWTRFAHRQAFVETLKAILSDPRHLKAYELTDGQKSQPDVAKASGLSQPTISGLWTKWRRLGLVVDEQGRARHLARPSDVGIEIPKERESEITERQPMVDSSRPAEEPPLDDTS